MFMIICCIFVDLCYQDGLAKERAFSLMQASIATGRSKERNETSRNPEAIRVLTARREIALKLLE
jgi:hypothetical protein